MPSNLANEEQFYAWGYFVKTEKKKKFQKLCYLVKNFLFESEMHNIYEMPRLRTI